MAKSVAHDQRQNVDDRLPDDVTSLRLKPMQCMNGYPR